MSIPISLAGKAALVTGASRAIGVGMGITRPLALAGACIFSIHLALYNSEQAWGSRLPDPQALLTELCEQGIRAVAA